MERNEAQEIIKRTVALSSADETEVLISHSEDNLTRFSDNAISQNVARSTDGLVVTVHLDKKLGRASTDRTDDDSLKRVVSTAILAAQQQKENPELLPLQGYAEFPDTIGFFKNTAEFGPDDRADAIERLVREASKHNASAAGIYNTGSDAVALGNSKGLFAYHRDAKAIFSATVEVEGVSGWAEDVKRDVSQIEEEYVIATAIRKALEARNPIAVDPGEYTVVLESAAVTDFLMFMVFEAFGGLSFIEGRSFMSGKLGKKVMGENVTIVDDAYSPDNPGMPFDFEGTARRKLVLIEKGMARMVAHDRLTAAKVGTNSTGHSLPQPNSSGPLPLNVMLEPGDSTLEEMVKSTDRGILVTHFHYSNVQDPIKLTLTGMTRDGTFLIEKGKVTRPVRNMRFTDGIVQAFNRIEMLSRDRRTAQAFFAGSFVTPALKISGFNFSSRSEF
jgi:predicted Zn-dependent protease